MKWIDPETINTVKNTGYVLAHIYYHKLFPSGRKCISNDGIESIDDKEWEIFGVSDESENAYYGMPLEGLGLFNCMLLKSDTRQFTENELESWKTKCMGMYGSTSGNLSYAFNVNVRQCESKLEK